MKLTKELLANAFALTAGILWVIDSLFVLLFPRFSLVLTRMWFHGLNIKPLGKFRITAYDFVVGGVLLLISAWVVGYVLGWSLEYFQKKKK